MRSVPAVVVLLAWVLTVVGVALSAAGFLGSAWWVLDLAAAFRHVYALVGLLALPVLALARQHAGAVLAVALVVVNAALVLPLWTPPPGAEPAAARAAGGTLTVEAHNHRGGGTARQRAAAARLPDATADVVVLFEVAVEMADEARAVDSPYEVVHPRPGERHRKVVVLSRVPVDAVAHVPLAGRDDAEAVALRVRSAAGPVRLLALHAASPRSAARAARRDAELADAAAWARRQREPAIVVGDLNVTPWNAAFRHLQRDGGLVSSQHGFGLQPTWPTAASLAPWPPVPGLPAPLRVPIDHLLHTPDLVAVDRRLGPSLGSTHRALEVELAPRRAPGAG